MKSTGDCIEVIRDCNFNITMFPSDKGIVAVVVCKEEVFKKEYVYNSFIDSPCWGRGQQLLDCIVFDALHYFVTETEIKL